jgi:hypothetical protein
MLARSPRAPAHPAHLGARGRAATGRLQCGIAACGPIGDFRRQLDYFDDFRVLYYNVVNVVGDNGAIITLGGQPFNNSRRLP